MAEMIMDGILETLYMTIVSTILAYVFGLPLGVLLVVSGKNGIKPMPTINVIISFIVNVFRSIPFLILLVAIIPFTRFIVGTMLGSTAAIVPLTVAAAPFVARLVETSLSEVDSGVVEAAESMGAGTWQIIRKVLLPEAKPSLINNATVATITILGYSAMAGVVGGGGLGDIAIRYGYYRYQTDIMLVTIVILVLLVQIMQWVGMLLSKKLDRRKA